MPGQGPKSHPCVLCHKRTKPKERRKVNNNIRKFLRSKFFTEAVLGDTICNRCNHHYYVQETKSARSSVSKADNDDDYQPPQKHSRLSATQSSPPSISLPIPSTAKSHAYCFICKKPGPKLVVVPSEAKFMVFVNDNILVPAGSRCCPAHLKDDLFDPASTRQQLSTFDTSLVNRETILALLQQFREFVNRSVKRGIDFDTILTLTDNDCMNLTGLLKQSFIEVCEYVKPLVRNTPVRSTQTSVGIFLLKLKSGISNTILSSLFNISRSSVRRAVSCVRNALMTAFVPANLGLQHISRQDVINDHTKPLAQTLFGDVAETSMILVLDGTYIYIQKSNNFQFQRRSYSIHKGRPLVKPMVVVTTTGYFVTIVGPYLADSKNSDAHILTHMLKSNVEDIRKWVHEDDIFIVDRGFRDSLSLLEDLGIRAEMPRFMRKGEPQMPTEDANTSRLVTKVRWVVESANARIKRWKYLDHVLPTNQVPHIGDYVRIACALSNKYAPPINPKSNEEEEMRLGLKMVYLAKQVNRLKMHVEENNLHTRSAVWKPSAESSVPDFPMLDEEQLRAMTCGVYQLKLASSYIQEHVDGSCDIQVHQEEDGLIRVRIQSRHISAKKYLLWIKYNPANVEGWYCKCRAGARVVGMCAHVASVLWYLGYAKHTDMNSFGVRNWGACLQDAAEIPDDVIGASSESDDSVIEE